MKEKITIELDETDLTFMRDINEPFARVVRLDKNYAVLISAVRIPIENVRAAIDEAEEKIGKVNYE